jgi:hypothetical protein
MEISQWASENEGSVPLINHIRSGYQIAVIALVFVVMTALWCYFAH